MELSYYHSLLIPSIAFSLWMCPFSALSKKFYNQAACEWMTSHPGETISIYDIPGIVKVALPNASTPKNIQAGFRACGIWEFNRNIFTDEDFLCSSVTDRQLDTPGISEVQQEPEVLTQKVRTENATPVMNEIQQQPEAETQVARIEDETQNVTPDRSYHTSTSGIHTSPDDLRPLPKAGKRKRNQNGRRTRKSAILTDTPVKEALREEQMRKENRTQGKGKKKLFSNKSQVIKKSKKYLEFSDSESGADDGDCVCLVCLQSYKDSRMGEQWIQCKECKNWAHVKCTNNDPFFVCLNCHSEIDEESDD